MSAPVTSTATHLPGQALEIAAALQKAELLVPEGTRPNNISLAIDTEASSVTITMTLPVVLSASGNVVTYTAADYLA